MTTIEAPAEREHREGAPDGATPAAPTGQALERRRVQEDLAGTLRVFARLGFEFGLNGHASVRDPLQPDHYWLNPQGLPLALTRTSDLLLVGPGDEIVQGDASYFSSGGFATLRAVHEARPDAVAVLHFHTLATLAWSSTGRLLDPLTQDSALFHGTQALKEEYLTEADHHESGRAAAAALGDEAILLIHRHHGFLTLGTSIAEAAWFFVAADRAAQTQLALEAVPGTRAIPDDVIGRARGFTRAMAAAHFRTHLTEVLAAEPDLLR